MALLSLGFRFLLAFVFLAASVPKLVAPREFHRAVLNYRVLPDRLVQPVAASLPRLELALAVALLAGVALPVTALAAAVLLLAMAAAVGTNLVRGRRIDCGCFGVEASRQIAWSLVAQNLLLALAASFVAVRPAGFQLVGLSSASDVTASSAVALAIAAAATVVGAALVAEMRRARPAMNVFSKGPA